MLDAYPYLFGGMRLIIGVFTLVKTLELFGVKKKADGFFAKHPSISIAIGVFLILSGLYTVLFSTADTYRV